MKKALVLILGLMMVGTMVFAQDAATVKFTGTVKTGAVITLDSDLDPSIAVLNNDDPNVSRIRLGVNASIGDFSLDYLITVDLTSPVGLPAYIPANFWVTALFLDKMVEMRFGAIDHKAVDTKNKGWGGLNTNGAQFVVVPITGLWIGAAVPAYFDDGVANLGDAQLLEDAFKNFAVGAKYSSPNLADFMLTYMGSSADDSADFAAGVNVTAVPNLVAQLEVLMSNIGGVAATDTNDIFENVEYTMAPFIFGVEGEQILYPSDTDLDMTISVKPKITYTIMTGTDIGASVKYTMAPSATVDSSLVVDPWVKFTFAKDMTLKIDAAYTIGDLSDSGVWTCPINANFIFAF